MLSAETRPSIHGILVSLMPSWYTIWTYIVICCMFTILTIVFTVKRHGASTVCTFSRLPLLHSTLSTLVGAYRGLLVRSFAGARVYLVCVSLHAHLFTLVLIALTPRMTARICIWHTWKTRSQLISISWYCCLSIDPDACSSFNIHYPLPITRNGTVAMTLPLCSRKCGVLAAAVLTAANDGRGSLTDTSSSQIPFRHLHWRILKSIKTARQTPVCNPRFTTMPRGTVSRIDFNDCGIAYIYVHSTVMTSLLS